MIRFLKKLLRVFLYGGRCAFHPYKDSIVRAFIRALPPGDRQVLELQFNARERLQRWNSDRMVILGFEDRNKLPKLSMSDENHRLGRVSLKFDSGTMAVALMAHRGVFSSMEFSKSPRVLRKNRSSAGSFRLYGKSPDYDAAMDSEEHESK